MLFGAAGQDLGYSFTADGNGFLLALLPPGAFLGLALLIALRNAIQQRFMARVTADSGAATKVTGYT
jgi:electron transport complex protein RnfE